jgi:tRNA pseudouridine38-40 synthase
LRYFVEISYNGSKFHGWQTQPNAVTVQETIEQAFFILLKKQIKLTAAGRTDSGVHATQMYAHFDLEEEDLLYRLKMKLNSFLGKDILVKNLYKMNKDAHARFDAIEREYKYFITQQKDVHNQENKFFFSRKLDFKLIQSATQIIKKNKNFKSFCRTRTDVTNYDCEIFDFRFEVIEHEIIFTIKANRFLRNMVRSIIGTILDIGLKKTSLKDLNNIIKKSNRIYAGPSAPAHGLFLTGIKYPENYIVHENKI